jgi:ABC-2 type transport system permease protein
MTLARLQQHLMNGRRIRAVALKETHHIARDPRSLIIAFLVPIVMVIIYGFGVSFDIDEVRIAVEDHALNSDSQLLYETLGNSRDFKIVAAPSGQGENLHLFRSGAAAATVVVPFDFSLQIPGKNRVQLLVDGADGTTAQTVLGTGMAVLSRFGRSSTLQLVRADTTLLYNSDLRSEVFLVPGIIAYVMSVACVLLTALTVAREWERGNIEQLFASPISTLEIVLGKLIPYLVLGLGQTVMVLTVGFLAFDVPLRGSVVLLFIGIFLFLVAMLLQGLLISIVTKNQQMATLGSSTATLLPVMLLSGFLFPIANMPMWLQYLSFLFPARYFIEVIRGVMLKGAELGSLAPQLVALLLFAILSLLVCWKAFRRVIE